MHSATSRVIGSKGPSVRIRLDHFALRLPSPAVHAAPIKSHKSVRSPNISQTTPHPPPTSPQGSTAPSTPSMSSSKASWSSILSAANYRGFLGSGNSGSSSGSKKDGKKKTKAVSEISRRVPTASPTIAPSEEHALAFGSALPPELASVMELLRRRRTVDPNSNTPRVPTPNDSSSSSATSTPKGRTHSQSSVLQHPQGARISGLPTSVSSFSSFRKAVPSSLNPSSSSAAIRLPNPNMGLHANFYEPPSRAVM